jgi:hypothetical protein
LGTILIIAALALIVSHERPAIVLALATLIAGIGVSLFFTNESSVNDGDSAPAPDVGSSTSTEVVEDGGSDSPATTSAVEDSSEQNSPSIPKPDVEWAIESCTRTGGGLYLTPIGHVWNRSDERQRINFHSLHFDTVNGVVRYDYSQSTGWVEPNSDRPLGRIGGVGVMGIDSVDRCTFRITSVETFEGVEYFLTDEVATEVPRS